MILDNSGVLSHAGTSYCVAHVVYEPASRTSSQFSFGKAVQGVHTSKRRPQKLYIHIYIYIYMDSGGTVVKVLCYKLEGRWFDPS